MIIIMGNGRTASLAMRLWRRALFEIFRKPASKLRVSPLTDLEGNSFLKINVPGSMLPWLYHTSYNTVHLVGNQCRSYYNILLLLLLTVVLIEGWAAQWRYGWIQLASYRHVVSPDGIAHAHRVVHFFRILWPSGGTHITRDRDASNPFDETCKPFVVWTNQSAGGLEMQRANTQEGHDNACHWITMIKNRRESTKA